MLHVLKPLSPNGDQHQLSPNDIHTSSREKVMRNNKMTTKGKYTEISLENLYVDIGA